MADTTISQLNTISTLSATNYAVISNSTQTSKIEINSFFGYRNRVTNGDMSVDQINNGALVGVPAYTFQYGVDRWQLNNGGSAAGLTMQRVIDAPPGFKYSLKISVTSPQTVTPSTSWSRLRHWMWLENFYDLSYGTQTAKPVTLSFWVKSNVLGNFPVAISYYSNGLFYRTFTTLFSINSVNTWEYKSITIPGDTVRSLDNNSSNNYYYGIRFALAEGSTYFAPSLNTWNDAINSDYISHSSATVFSSISGASMNITGVQLEAGSLATPFENIPNTLNLLRCQETCVVIGGDNNGFAPFATGYIRNSNTAFFMRQLSPFFRYPPSLSANPGAFIIDDVNVHTPTAITLDRYGNGTVMFTAAVTNNALTPGRGALLYSNPAGTGRLIIYNGY